MSFNNFRKKSFWGALAICLAVSFSACYPGGPVYVSDLDLVSTNYDETYKFGAAKTYFLFDSVLHIRDNNDDDNNEDIDRTFDPLILDQIEQNMNQRGYQRIPDADPNNLPDLVVMPSVIVTKNSGVIVPGYPWYPGWGWWPGWGFYPGYGPGWGYGYPWGGYPISYSYSTGTILIEMVDPAEVDTANEVVDLIWNAGINGLLTSNEGNTASRIQNSINQAFTQSPYLRSE